MVLFEWNDSYSVGVSVFNEEHKKIINLINNLYEAMKTGRGKESLGSIFNELVDYTVVHFNNEEAMMRKYNYPGLEDQVSEHKKLTSQVRELEAKFKGGASFVTIDVLNFLKDWLTNHIAGSDKKYGPFFNGKGIK